MGHESCYRVCGDRSQLVLEKIGYRYSNVLLDQRRAIERAIRLDVKFALDLGRPRFGVSRYSDGSWPVLYTASDDATSFHEVAFHARREWLVGLTPGSLAPTYKSSKKLLYVLGVDRSSQQDLSIGDPKLVESDYAYCHTVASSARSAGYSSIRVPSARRAGGVCVPVFNRSVVRVGASTSIACTIRWYPSSDKLFHYAGGSHGGVELVLWHK